MQRRRFLAAAGASAATLAAGCLEGVLGPAAGRAVSLVDVGTVGEAHPIELDARLRTRVLGPESAPAVEVSLRSTADEPLAVAYAESWPADGLAPERDSTPAELRLLSAREASDLTVERGDCPTTDYRPITSAVDGRGHVRAGERIARRYLAVGAADALDASCPPGGRYRFEATYAYRPAAGAEDAGFPMRGGTRLGWGFTVEVPSGN